MYVTWALCLAEDLSVSRGGEVLVNFGVIVVFESEQQAGIAKWQQGSLGKMGLLDVT